MKNYWITLIRGNYETLGRHKFFITVSIQDFRQVQMLLLSQRRLRLHVPKHPGTNVQKYDFLLINDVIKIWKNWQFPSCIPVPMSKTSNLEILAPFPSCIPLLISKNIIAYYLMTSHKFGNIGTFPLLHPGTNVLFLVLP